MAALSSQQAAREQQPSDQLASLYSLVHKVVRAGALDRHSRSAELSGRAALEAEALFGDESLVVAELRMNESEALNNLAATASGAERDALVRRSWSALLSVIALLQRRLTTNTLLIGTVRKEESDYFAHVHTVRCAAQNMPSPLPAVVQVRASAIGYLVLLDALYRSLNFMFSTLRPL